MLVKAAPTMVGPCALPTPLLSPTAGMSPEHIIDVQACKYNINKKAQTNTNKITLLTSDRLSFYHNCHQYFHCKIGEILHPGGILMTSFGCCCCCKVSSTGSDSISQSSFPSHLSAYSKYYGDKQTDGPNMWGINRLIGFYVSVFYIFIFTKSLISKKRCFYLIFD